MNSLKTQNVLAPLALAMTLALAGCGGEGSAGTEKASAEAEHGEAGHEETGGEEEGADRMTITAAAAQESAHPTLNLKGLCDHAVGLWYGLAHSGQVRATLFLALFSRFSQVFLFFLLLL